MSEYGNTALFREKSFALHCKWRKEVWWFSAQLLYVSVHRELGTQAVCSAVWWKFVETSFCDIHNNRNTRPQWNNKRWTASVWTKRQNNALVDDGCGGWGSFLRSWSDPQVHAHTKSCLLILWWKKHLNSSPHPPLIPLLWHVVQVQRRSTRNVSARLQQVSTNEFDSLQTLQAYICQLPRLCLPLWWVKTSFLRWRGHLGKLQSHSYRLKRARVHCCKHYQAVPPQTHWTL